MFGIYYLVGYEIRNLISRFPRNKNIVKTISPLRREYEIVFRFFLAGMHPAVSYEKVGRGDCFFNGRGSVNKGGSAVHGGERVE